MASAKYSFWLFVLFSILAAIVGTSTAAPPTGRPSRGDRTVPPEILLNLLNQEEKTKNGDIQARQVRSTSEAGSSPPGKAEAVKVEVAEVALATGSASDEKKILPSRIRRIPRYRRKSTHTRRSAKKKSGSSPSMPSTVNQQNSGVDVDYYYYYFDSFAEGIAGGMDFDEMSDKNNRSMNSKQNEDEEPVMGLLTRETWHKSKKKE